MKRSVLGGGLILGGILLEFAAAASPSTATAIAALSADPNSKLAVDLIAKAQFAMLRADRMRHAGDETHAVIADQVALRWVAAATELMLTIAAEARVR